jgi:non-ribosomal peptide synthetase component F
MSPFTENGGTVSDIHLGADQLLVGPEIRPTAVYPARPPAPPRTLLDILDATAAACPDALALDDGETALSYVDLCAQAGVVGNRLRAAGIGVGDRVGVRISSGTAELYLAILGVLSAGAGYVPVDVDDPPERADLVWAEADVTAVLADGGELTLRRPPVGRSGAPTPRDDAWIIFTSGSTGTPKGVAVTHRNAAAFADAEARLFLPHDPIGPGDRVLAGLSVAFDASCEEMWLAWRNGACLVPAPRSLVKSGADLGEWLRRKRISAVSTVPTLAAMWPVADLAGVRLLIFGGEACPPEPGRGSPTAPARCGTPTARPRRRWWPVRPGWPPTSRCASAGRWTAGSWRWSIRTASRWSGAAPASW